jgi:hypothetical protein
MPYTVWSHGRLLGESALDYQRVFPRHRMGDFFPTEAGEKVMPIATGVSKAGVDLVRSLSGAPPGSPARAHLRETSEYADLASAEDHYDALALELRGPDGCVIPTEWIDLRDTEFLLGFAGDEADASSLELDFSSLGEDDFGDPPPHFDEAPDFELDFDDDDAPWRPELVFPRYQLQVMLRNDAAVP